MFRGRYGCIEKKSPCSVFISLMTARILPSEWI